MDKSNQYHLRRNSGITLIGVIVTLGLLTTGVVALSRILISRKDVVGSGREKLVAVSVAREGLELVHALRDTNWFGEEDWTKNICDGDQEFTLDARQVRNNEPNGDADEDELFRTDEGEWVHDGSAGETTGYHRRLQVNCDEQSGDPEVIAITAEVKWESRGQEQVITVQEKLFNWLPPAQAPASPSPPAP